MKNILSKIKMLTLLEILHVIKIKRAKQTYSRFDLVTKRLSGVVLFH